MKQTTRTSRAAGQLEKMFRKLNEHYFEGTLEEPIITITPQRTSYGYCTTCRNIRVKENDKHEISISSYFLGRPIEETTATLVHEMVHLWNLQNGIQDCSRGGTYHNKKFKEKAEKCGLKIDHDEKYGWTITNPTEELIEFIISEGWTEIQINETGILRIGIKGKGTPGDDEQTPTPRKTSWKWICPNCGMIVRSTKDLTGKIACVDCIKTMIEC